ncbi:hypothetical protein HJG60_009696 [Phyllostomus discolor]|uniref:Uncharacterized protein n=1 Tax=Phyllostomus discolor TaxID=89673 RepID=A0A834EPT3_9CHIR|nr:hypothetical protein HJG60_009696 [Phyllostomus discolor]
MAAAPFYIPTNSAQRFLHIIATHYFFRIYIYFFFFFNILFTYFQGEGKGERREKHPCVVASLMPSTGDLAHNPGMCPDWDSNQQTFGSQTGAQSTEPHQPGVFFTFLILAILTDTVFICISLMISDVENLFTCLLIICMS